MVQATALQLEKKMPDSLGVISERLDERTYTNFIVRLTRITASLGRRIDRLEMRNSARGWLGPLKRAHSRHRVVRLHTHTLANLIEKYGAERVVVRQYTNYIYDPHFEDGLSRLVPDVLCQFGNITEAELVRIMFNRTCSQTIRRLGSILR